MAGIIAAVLAAMTFHTSFAVVDNGGVLVTRHHLAVHQVIYCAGVAETVQSVHGYVIRVTPAFPASDAGKVVSCTT